jgi:predicted phosphodiesterase
MSSSRFMSRGRRAVLYGFCALGLILIAGYSTLHLWQVSRKRPQARGPYLQSVTSGSVWVVWDTTRPVIGNVEYGLTSNLGQMAEEVKDSLHHEVRLMGLEPYTAYYYRVDGGQTATFRTAADTDQTAFRYVVFGDTRGSSSIHRAIVKQIVKSSPDFVIHTGDLVESGRSKSEWDRFFQIEAPLLGMAPFFPTLGNHEDHDPKRLGSHYLDIFHLPGNELWYAFDYGNARFICLKADGYPVNEYFPDEEQLAWLEGQLAANDAPWLFVYFHIGVFTSREDGFLELGLRERLVPLFERYGVDAVFMGHHHSYERVIVNGVTYIVTAGGGAGLYNLEQPEPGSQVAARVHHYVVVDVNGDRLSGTAIDRDGQVIDRFELQTER